MKDQKDQPATKHPEHNPDAEGEVFQAMFMPVGVRQIILDYWHMELSLTVSSESEQDRPSLFYDKFKLFGRGLGGLAPDDVKSQLGELANQLLSGKDSLFTLLERPISFQVPITVEYSSVPIRGKIIEIMAMAGDVTHCFERGDLSGQVEKLAYHGKLTVPEITHQLQVIQGKEAKKANAARNAQILDVMKTFMEQVLKTKADDNFSVFQKKCLPAILALRDDMAAIRETPVSCGYLFDAAVIHQVGELFEKLLDAFGGLNSVKTGVFALHGFGLLQKQLSARDKQIVLSGLNGFLKNKPTVPRDVVDDQHWGMRYYIDQNGKQNTAQNCQTFAPNIIQAMKAYGTLAKLRDTAVEKCAERVKEKLERMGQNRLPR